MWDQNFDSDTLDELWLLLGILVDEKTTSRDPRHLDRRLIWDSFFSFLQINGRVFDGSRLRTMSKVGNWRSSRKIGNNGASRRRFVCERTFYSAQADALWTYVYVVCS